MYYQLWRVAFIRFHNTNSIHCIPYPTTKTRIQIVLSLFYLLMTSDHAIFDQIYSRGL